MMLIASAARVPLHYFVNGVGIDTFGLGDGAFGIVALLGAVLLGCVSPGICLGTGVVGQRLACSFACTRGWH